jgi:hypothetical protein
MPWKHRGEEEVWSHSFFTLAAGGCDWLALRPGRYSPRSRTKVGRLWEVFVMCHISRRQRDRGSVLGMGNIFSHLRIIRTVFKKLSWNELIHWYADTLPGEASLYRAKSGKRGTALYNGISCNWMQSRKEFSDWMKLSLFDIYVYIALC